MSVSNISGPEGPGTGRPGGEAAIGCWGGCWYGGCWGGCWPGLEAEPEVVASLARSLGEVPGAPPSVRNVLDAAAEAARRGPRG